MHMSTVVSPSHNQSKELPGYIRIALVLAVAALQLSAFYATYYLYHVISYPAYLDLETWLDRAVPYVAGTWILYYFGFAYILGWGAAGIWSLTNRAVWRTIKIYAILVLTGGVLRLIFPSDSPWPLVAELSAAQRSFKSSYGIQPLGGFPSMHAALTVLPAYISIHVFKSRITRTVSIVLASLVCISIVTAKEHWAIDVPAGIALGLAAGYIWRQYVWRPDRPDDSLNDQVIVSGETLDGPHR